MISTNEKMIVLQSNDKFDEIAIIDVDNGKISLFSKTQNSEIASLATQGFYSVVEEKMCSFYRKGDDLHLEIDEQDFVISDKITSQFIHTANQHIFKLLDGSTLILSFRYNPPQLVVPLEDDPTPFVDYEDFNFLYFVHNVLKDTKRRQRIFK